ncbi:MAG: hypothetical protein K2X11_11995 [Acetobacteraceae bacterium]|nr:hypothetical protein [Acetobacteraceae bacterium]
MQIVAPTSDQPRLPNLPTTGEDTGRQADTKEPLQVRIPVAVKRRFKAHAAMHGKEPNQLFVEVWEFYERAKGGTDDWRKGKE